LKSIKTGKIALINPPYILNEPLFQQMPPLSLLYLAANLEKEGFEPLIYHLDKVEKYKRMYFFSFNINQLISDLERFQPDMIGITCPYSARWTFTQRLIHLLKKRFDDIPIVLGGIHPTAFPEYSLSSSEADFVILGEGEVSVVKLMRTVLSKGNVSHIDGLAYKKDGKCVVNPKTQFIDTLDDMPLPAYHLLDINKYKQLYRNDRISQLKGVYFSLLTSRSCPNQCTYCNMFLAHGRKWRPRSPENVLDEIEYLKRKYHIDQFNVVDDNFSLSRKRTGEILRGIIKRNLDIKFITSNGLSIKTLDEELVMLMKKAGALEICIAVESGSEFIRNEVYNKKISSEQIYRTVDACRKHKLPVRTFFMIGAPGETDETIRESIDLIKRMKVPAYINITTPYKGTKLFDDYLKKGLISEQDVQKGTTIDLKLPIEKAENYDKILKWKRQMQFINVVHSWKDIIFSPSFFNFNALSRYVSGILFPAKVDKQIIDEIINKHLSP
jgi:magnesium-protoporphyrin IX monomethyl ester (oxidative) cyclase